MDLTAVRQAVDHLKLTWWVTRQGHFAIAPDSSNLTVVVGAEGIEAPVRTLLEILLALRDLVEVDVGGWQHFLDLHAGNLLERQRIGVGMDGTAHEQIAADLASGRIGQRLVDAQLMQARAAFEMEVVEEVGHDIACRRDEIIAPRCAIAIDEASPVLTRHAERIYTWISDASIVVPEVLLVPLYLGGKDPLGTLWIVSDEDGHFNGAHARCATELATFVGIALRMTRVERKLRQALDEQQTIAREMSHRVKNLFALANSMIRFGLKSARSKEELAAGLSGRLHALASARTLVLASEEESAVTDLAALIRSIVEPHEMAGEGALSRFTLTGPTLACEASAVSGMALVFNELATNATKYGALTSEAGHVAIEWRQEGEDVVLRWTETGGAPIDAEPARHGFGTRLLESTIVRQFKGTFEHDWQAGGVVVTIRLPAGILSSDT